MTVPILTWGKTGNIIGDFHIAPAHMDYIILYISAVAIIFYLVIIILNCIARIFNMMFLYIIAPPIFASAPLDGGSRTKQWITAFTIQSLSVFGTVISMRLPLIYLPIISSPKLKLFDNEILNLMSKLLLIYGGFETAKKATAMLTGILAENAGAQAIHAGDMTSQANRLVRGTAAMGAGAGRVAGKLAGKTALAVGRDGAATLGFLDRPLQNLGIRAYRATLKKPVDAVKRAGNWWSNLGTGHGVHVESGQKPPPPLPDSQSHAGTSNATGSSRTPPQRSKGDSFASQHRKLTLDNLSGGAAKSAASSHKPPIPQSAKTGSGIPTKANKNEQGGNKPPILPNKKKNT